MKNVNRGSYDPIQCQIIRVNTLKFNEYKKNDVKLVIDEI